ncbi:MAG: hypothetical protein AAF367_17700 [Pseudomonadota bacterium]
MAGTTANLRNNGTFLFTSARGEIASWVFAMPMVCKLIFIQHVTAADAGRLLGIADVLTLPTGDKLHLITS